MTRFRSIVAGALVAGLLAAGASYAQGPRAGGPGAVRQGGPGRGMMEGLPLGAVNLTQAQQDLIADIRQRAREEARPLQEKLRAAQQAQRDAIDTLPLNEALVRTTTLALADAQAEVALHEARLRNEVFMMLTGEQQAQVRQLLAQREQRAAQRQQQRGARPQARPNRQ